VAKLIVPNNIGNLIVFKHTNGFWYVSNDQGGKNRIYIPCKTERQATELRRRLVEGDHNGQLNIPHVC
jgi:hypothetical protein